MNFRASAGLLGLFIVIASFACTTEKTVYVLPDGTEVTPTAAQATQAAGGGSQMVSTSTPHPKPAPSLTATAIARRKDRLIRHIIENRPPIVTGYGRYQSHDFTPDCAEFYYHYGSIFSGIPPHFGYSVPAQGVFSVVIDCDDDGNHYFTDESYVDMLWEYLGGE